MCLFWSVVGDPAGCVCFSRSFLCSSLNTEADQPGDASRFSRQNRTSSSLSAGRWSSRLTARQNDGLCGCRGQPEEVPHVERGGPGDLHDCVQEPLDAGNKLTSFQFLTPGLSHRGWWTVCELVCLCVGLLPSRSDPDSGSETLNPFTAHLCLLLPRKPQMHLVSVCVWRFKSQR